MNLEIRKMENKDVPDVVRLLKQVETIHHLGRPDLFKANVIKYNENQIKNILREKNSPSFVALEDGKVIGYAFCIIKQFLNDNVRTDIKTMYIDDLCVDENARGKGIGKKVYDTVAKYAVSNGCHNITLNAWSCNEPAIKFYEKCGLLPQKICMEKILK